MQIVNLWLKRSAKIRLSVVLIMKTPLYIRKQNEYLSAKTSALHVNNIGALQ